MDSSALLREQHACGQSAHQRPQTTWGPETSHHQSLTWCFLPTGMDFYVVLERAGYRVARRRRCKAKIGHQHKLTKEDAMKWFQTKFEGIILNKAHGA